jgi:hypothetical protein
MSSEELKKEWRKQFEANFLDGDSMYDCGNATFSVDGVLDVCEFFLAKQQDTPMGYSAWVAYGKKFGYHDYWKDMTRIALQEEFVKMCCTTCKNVIELRDGNNTNIKK